MSHGAAQLINRVLRIGNLRISRVGAAVDFPVEFDDEDRDVCEHVIGRKLTMVGREGVFSTLLACRHVCNAGVVGDFVECGVWRGGNSIVAADVFGRLDRTRRVHLFDTFEGMTQPTSVDVGNRDGEPALRRFLAGKKDTHNEWCYASLDDVKANFAVRGLQSERIRYVKGDVLETLLDPANLPEKIAVLRLDTDWYESTKLELEVLWPRLQSGGVLIVDDYGHWGGAQKAVDEFFEQHPRPLLQYVNYTVRAAVKA